MSIDEKLYQLPIAGPALRRTHSYFRNHVTVTDLFHVLMGIAIGLVVASFDYLVLGISALVAALLYHVYAYVQGTTEEL